jgi:hypothetical protein
MSVQNDLDEKGEDMPTDSLGMPMSAQSDYHGREESVSIDVLEEAERCTPEPSLDRVETLGSERVEPVLIRHLVQILQAQRCPRDVINYVSAGSLTQREWWALVTLYNRFFVGVSDQVYLHFSCIVRTLNSIAFEPIDVRFIEPSSFIYSPIRFWEYFRFHDKLSTIKQASEFISSLSSKDSVDVGELLEFSSVLEPRFSKCLTWMRSLSVTAASLWKLRDNIINPLIPMIGTNFETLGVKVGRGTMAAIIIGKLCGLSTESSSNLLGKLPHDLKSFTSKAAIVSVKCEGIMHRNNVVLTLLLSFVLGALFLSISVTTA